MLWTEGCVNVQDDSIVFNVIDYVNSLCKTIYVSSGVVN